jgi:hypothetical protein
VRDKSVMADITEDTGFRHSCAPCGRLP